MHYLFVTLLLFQCHCCLSQIENNNTEPASNSINNTLADTTIIKEEFYESISIEAEEDEYNEDTKSKKKQNRKDQKTLEKKEKSSIIYKIQSQSFQDANDKLYLNKKISRQQSFQRNPTIEQQSIMQNANDILEVEDPNSFEYNLNKYVIGNYNTDNYLNLISAEKINPKDEELIRQMAAHNIITNDKSKSNYYLNKLKENGDLDKMSLKYCEDLLMSAPKNGTLITHGMVDSYGTHLNQISKHLREDVQIINLDFLQSESYKKELNSKGYYIPKAQNIDVSFVRQFCEKNESKKLALSLTIPKNYLIPLQNQLYISGLVFEYHLNGFPVDLINKNILFWNEKMNKAVLSTNDDLSKKLASNYLPMLLNIRKYYSNQGNDIEVIKIDKQINSISQKCGKTKQIKKLKSAY